MNKKELINFMMKRVEKFSRSEVENLVGVFIESLKDLVVEGEEIKLFGFGVFRTKIRKARTVKNPKTKESTNIGERKAIVFKPSSVFTDLLANDK